MRVYHHRLRSPIGSKTGPGQAPAGEAKAQELYLQALIRAEPRHWPAQVRLATLLETTGRTGEAFEVLRNRARQSPRNVAVQSAISEVAQQADYLDWCLYSWLKVTRESPRMSRRG